MALNPDTLPDDPARLKELAYMFSQENDWLREQLRLVTARMFGRSSEKGSSLASTQQLPLFETAVSEQESNSSPRKDETTIPEHTRAKPGRRPLPAWLPRVPIVCDVSEAEKVCGCGTCKDRIGQEESEQLDYEPARLRVLHYIRPKYACPKCEGTEDPSSPTVVIAPPLPHIIPKSMATPALLTHTLISKFADGLPFYRQEGQFRRLGVKIERATMCNWALKVATACQPLYLLLQEETLAGPLVQADETTLLVLAVPGRSTPQDSYVWVFVGGRIDKPAVVFLYSPTRSALVPFDYLRHYQGNVLTDAYVGYDFLDDMPGVTHSGCWAHARRGFKDVVKVVADLKPLHPPEGGVAAHIVEKMRLLYAVEASGRKQGLDPAEVLALRQEKSKPIVGEIKTIMEANIDLVPPKCLLGKSLSYLQGQWPRLENFLKDGHIPLDNNVAENAIRPFALGRKSWMFSGTPEGAHASAVHFTMIESAKANGLEPSRYYRYLLEHLPMATTKADYKLLLPQYVDRAKVGLPAP